MDLRRQLTTELLGEKFDSSFELVSHAIDLAKRMLEKGHPIEGTAEVRNQAYQILTKVLLGDEVIEPYVDPDDEEFYDDEPIIQPETSAAT